MTGESYPEIIWWNGRIVHWAEAMVHVTSETAMRGTNVFEGLRAYWQRDRNSFAIVALTEHIERLGRSARVLKLPVDNFLPKLTCGVHDLVRALGYRENLYLRPTIYLEYGHYTAHTEDMRVGAFISGRPTETRSDQPIECVVSTWQRIADNSLPPLAKIGAAYTAFRLARMEASEAGADEAILLNDRGMVAETGGAAVFIVRKGQVYTPPHSDGVLEGVTRRIVIDLLSTQLEIPVTERSILRSELYIADEVFICGTLDEIRAVSSVDHRPLPNAPGDVTRAIRKLFLDLCEGRQSQGAVPWLYDVSVSATPLK